MHECSSCTPGWPQENDGSAPWLGTEDEWREDCPTTAVPAWVFDAARWFRLFERDQTTPMTFGRANWLPLAFIEVMQEFAAAEAEEKSKAAARKGRG